MLTGHRSTNAVYKKAYIAAMLCVPLFVMGGAVLSNNRTYMIAWLGFFGYLIFFVISLLALPFLKEKAIKIFIGLSPFIYLIIQPFGRPLYLTLTGHFDLAKNSIYPFYGYVLVYGVIYLVLGYLFIATAWLLWRWIFRKFIPRSNSN